MRKHHLPELPLTVGVTGSNTPHFPDMLVLDGCKESVDEACGEVAGRLLSLLRHPPIDGALTALLHSYSLIHRDPSHFAVI